MRAGPVLLVAAVAGGASALYGGVSAYGFAAVVACIGGVLWTACAVCGVAALALYVVPVAWHAWVWSPQDLKRKYGAEWAVVTGASSGIGKALTWRLARQGLNVVVVGMPDKLLTATISELEHEFSSLSFPCVGVNLGAPGFMDAILRATEDKVVQAVFLNAGYIRTGCFTDVPLVDHVANFNCNAACLVPLAHHFIRKLQTSSRRGCVVFTSSPAGFMGCPFSSIYGATKAFVTEFAMSIAPEVKADGVDVTVVHPSPVNSNFFANATHKIDIMDLFKATGTSPDNIAEVVLASVGRTVVRDQGYYSVGLRLLLKVVDTPLLADITTRVAHLLPDYKRNKGKA